MASGPAAGVLGPVQPPPAPLAGARGGGEEDPAAVRKEQAYERFMRRLQLVMWIGHVPLEDVRAMHQAYKK
jgi:hypothetical protein